MKVHPHSFWITGPVRSGKTHRLAKQFQCWVEADSPLLQRWDRQVGAVSERSPWQQLAPSILIFASNAENRSDLVEEILRLTGGRYSVNSTTPLGFFEEEVLLFWPLLVQQLQLPAHFPLRLRPENEQELATRLWEAELAAGALGMAGMSDYRRVRRSLDLMQLAAFSGTPLEDLPILLAEGGLDPELPPQVWADLGRLLSQWRDWCLGRGLLTYGILTELYWRHLLPDPTYQQHLSQRYRAVLADDVDNYPAIACDLFELLLQQGAVGAFSANPDGAIRLGLGADPVALESLSQFCQREVLQPWPGSSLGEAMGPAVVECLTAPRFSLPESILCLQTSSRSQLLRQTGAAIVQAVKSGQVAPADIAVIGPGLDAIARYTLIEILSHQGIPVLSLNDQRPLNSSPMIRALLTLLALVYPGAGRLVEREQVAEMLVVLTQERLQQDSDLPLRPRIDPVRAGILADACFQPHPDQPRLLAATSFPRWDRLGYAATTAYTELLSWLEQQRSQQEQRFILSPITVLDRAIQKFLWPHNLAYDQLAALRELLETAQHYWQVDTRLRQVEPQDTPAAATVNQFLRLIRGGTITANPFPARWPMAGRRPSRGQQSGAVMLATTFQYRSARQSHRWHFWLDAGSTLWQGGGAVVLWGAPLFLRHWSSRVLTLEDQIQQDQEQLRRLLLDLLSRVQERVYLCHSELSVSGQEQMGPLLPLVDVAMPWLSGEEREVQSA